MKKCKWNYLHILKEKRKEIGFVLGFFFVLFFKKNPLEKLMCSNLLIQNAVTPASQSLRESKSSLNPFLTILCCLSGQETYLYARCSPYHWWSWGTRRVYLCASKIGLFVHFRCSISSHPEVTENSVCSSVSCSSRFLLSWFSCRHLI